MNDSTEPPADASVAVKGHVNYMTAQSLSSLHANGRVLIQRDIDGNSSGYTGVDLDLTEVSITNARRLEPSLRCSLRAHGFEVHDRPLSVPDLDFLDHEAVVRSYYPDCAALVREASGASEVFAFDHNVRSAGGKEAKRRISGGQDVQGPARVVHGDYTLTSAPKRLRDFGRPPAVNDTYRLTLPEGASLISEAKIDAALADGGRFAIINVWRNIAEAPVATHQLALCHGQSVDPEDLVVFEIHYPDRVGENYFAKRAPGHQWFFYPGLTRDEALLIKQWDSSGPLARSGGSESDRSDPSAPSSFSFHTAFEDPQTPEDAPDRWSIEVRCIALFDE